MAYTLSSIVFNWVPVTARSNSGAITQDTSTTQDETVSNDAPTTFMGGRAELFGVMVANSGTPNFDKRPGYAVLQATLDAMFQPEADDIWTIDGPVYSASTNLLEQLNKLSVVEPRLMSHGPKSVVFSWDGGGQNYYLTVSARSVGLLISESDNIQLRLRLPSVNTKPTLSVLGALQYAPLLPSS